MEQQENPDNNNVVESKFEPLDHLRSAVRSRLRQLHVINIEQQAAYDAFRSPSEKSIEPQQASVIKSVPVKNTSPASTKDCKIAELQASESSSNAMTICNFPNEVMYKILKNLTFDGIAVNRSVCRYFDVVCSDILNSEFKCLRNLIQQRLQTLKSQMPRRESARRQHHLSREFDIIETVNMRLSLMQTMFSKHIDRGHCPFFAGQVLDEVRRILHYLKTTPVINFSYKVTDELFDLSTMAVEYFKERIEPSLPDISYIGGFNDFHLFDSVSSSSGSIHGLDVAPISSKSLEGIPEFCSPNDYSSLISLSANELSFTNTQESSQQETSTRTRNPFSRSATRRIKKLERRNKRANRTIKSLQLGLRVCKRKLSSNQKQIRQYHSHFEDYDKKLDATCAKLDSVMEELTKCKTEIQYLRSINPPSQTLPSTTVLLTPESVSSFVVAKSRNMEGNRAIKRKIDFVDLEGQ